MPDKEYFVRKGYYGPADERKGIVAIDPRELRCCPFHLRLGKGHSRRKKVNAPEARGIFDIR